MSIVSGIKKYSKIFLIVLVLADMVFAVSFGQSNFVSRPRIIFMNVGEGDAILIDAEGDNQILIDGGNGKDILDEVGKYMPINDKKIELMISTHPDKDHLGGLAEVLKYYEVEKIVQTGVLCKTALCEKWQRLIREKNVDVEYARLGERYSLKNVQMDVLYPFESLENKEVKSDNDASIILKVQLPKNSYLLTGDAGFEEEKDLADNHINIKADILKVSHHGSKYASSDGFLQLVGPKEAIISVGKNSYGHPAPELLERIGKDNVKIQRTDENGDIVRY